MIQLYQQRLDRAYENGYTKMKAKGKTIANITLLEGIYRLKDDKGNVIACVGGNFIVSADIPIK